MFENIIYHYDLMRMRDKPIINRIYRLIKITVENKYPKTKTNSYFCLL